MNQVHPVTKRHPPRKARPFPPGAFLDSTVAGIPCTIRVDYFFQQKPLGPRCDSDMDCHGYTEVDFTVCDQRGRPAPWLAKKLSPDAVACIKCEIQDAHEQDMH